MAYEMDMKKGLYPDEPGYMEFKACNFPNEMAIEGTLTKQFQYIHPQKFHKKFLAKRLCGLDGNISPTYTDIKIRNDIEMTNNKRYFQPKEWNLEKLLYNYDCLYHLWHQDKVFNLKYIKYMKMHIWTLYQTYKVPEEKRFIKVRPSEI